MKNGFFVEERRKKIVELLDEEKRVKVKDLAALFSVTEDLIRKDFNVLEKKGILTRTYGGAVLKTKMSDLVPYKERMKQSFENMELAKAAAELVEDGDTIFLESSSYVNRMIPFLTEKKRLTVVTNAIHSLTELLPYATVIQTGGIVHEEDEAAYGRFATECASQVYYDKSFLSLAGVTPTWMVTAAVDDSATLKNAVINNSKQTVMLISWDKWNHQGIYHVCSVKDIDTIITDSTNREVTAYLKMNGVQFIQTL